MSKAKKPPNRIWVLYGENGQITYGVYEKKKWASERKANLPSEFIATYQLVETAGRKT